MTMVFLALCLSIVAAAPAPAPPPGAPPAAVGGYPNEEALRRYVQGRLLEEEDDPSQALNEYFRALHLDARASGAAQRVSEVSARMGDSHQSLEFAEKALAIAPGDARSLWLKGGALFNLGRPEDALEALEAAVAADSERAEYQATLARVAEGLDRHDIAARAWRGVVTIDENDGEAWFRLAAAEARSAHFEAAKRALAEANNENPDRQGALFLEGWIEEGLGNNAGAIKLYQQHLAAHPRDDATRRRLVGLLAETGRNGDAYKEAQLVSKARPGDPDALAVEADLAFKAGRSTDALKTLDRLAAVAPDDPENVRQRVEVLARNKRGKDAVKLAETWAGENPDDARGMMLTARAKFLAGDREAGLVDARRAVTMEPDSLTPQLLLGRLAQVAGKWPEAAAAWQEVLRRDPDRPGVGFDLAYCREQAGDLAGAEKAARDVLRSHPDEARAQNFLGYLLADHNLKLEEARRLIELAVAQEPDNGAYVDSMGWVYFRLGRLSDARRELERAVVLTGGDAVVCEHLGDVYKELRLNELAREQYKKSLAADHSNSRVRTKLDGLR
jgi:tetratricopeptide (TPR) repeat protein